MRILKTSLRTGLVALAATLALATACSRPRVRPFVAEHTPPAPEYASQFAHVSLEMPESLRVGDRITARIEVTNAGTGALTLLDSGDGATPCLSFLFQSQSGGERVIDIGDFDPDLEKAAVLQPGESWQFDVVLPDRLPGGTYDAVVSPFVSFRRSDAEDWGISNPARLTVTWPKN